MQGGATYRLTDQPFQSNPSTRVNVDALVSSAQPNPVTMTANRRFVNSSISTSLPKLAERNSIGGPITTSKIHNTEASGTSNSIIKNKLTDRIGRSFDSPLMFQVNPWNVQTLLNLESQKQKILNKLNTLQTTTHDSNTIINPGVLFVPSKSFWSTLESEFPLDFTNLKHILKKAVELCSTSFQGEEWLFVEQVFKFVAIQVANSLQGVAAINTPRNTLLQQYIPFRAADCNSDLTPRIKQNTENIFKARAKSIDLNTTTVQTQGLSHAMEMTAPSFLRQNPLANKAPCLVPISNKTKIQFGVRALHRLITAREKLRLIHCLFLLHRNMCLSRDEQWEIYSREAESYWLQRSKKREAELVQDLKDQEEELQRLRDSYLKLYLTEAQDQTLTLSQTSSANLQPKDTSENRITVPITKSLLILLKSLERRLKRRIIHEAFHELRSFSRQGRPQKEEQLKRATRAHTMRHHPVSAANSATTAVSGVNHHSSTVKPVPNAAPLLSARSLSPLSRERSRIFPIRPAREPQMSDTNLSPTDTGYSRSISKSPLLTSGRVSPNVAEEPSRSPGERSEHSTIVACVPSVSTLPKSEARPPGSSPLFRGSPSICTSPSLKPSVNVEYPPDESSSLSGNRWIGTKPLSTINRTLPLKEVKSQSVYVPTLGPMTGKQQLSQRRVLRELSPNGSQSARGLGYHYSLH